MQKAMEKGKYKGKLEMDDDEGDSGEEDEDEEEGAVSDHLMHLGKLIYTSF